MRSRSPCWMVASPVQPTIQPEQVRYMFPLIKAEIHASCPLEIQYLQFKLILITASLPWKHLELIPITACLWRKIKRFRKFSNTYARVNRPTLSAESAEHLFKELSDCVVTLYASKKNGAVFVLV